jgi:hypothetical protein
VREREERVCMPGASERERENLPSGQHELYPTGDAALVAWGPAKATIEKRRINQ